jgi:hypothetical protein
LEYWSIGVLAKTKAQISLALVFSLLHYSTTPSLLQAAARWKEYGTASGAVQSRACRAVAMAKAGPLDSDSLLLLAQHQLDGTVRKKKENNSAQFDKGHAVVIHQGELVFAHVEPLGMNTEYPITSNHIAHKPNYQESKTKEKTPQQDFCHNIKAICRLICFHNCFLPTNFSSGLIDRTRLPRSPDNS